MTAKTTTFTVILPTGETVTRGSKTKTYTHAVAVRKSGQVAQLRQELAEKTARMEEIAESHPNAHAWFTREVTELAAAVEGQPEDATVAVGDWGLTGWCSRPDLAEKLAAKSRKDWGRDVAVLEVH